MKLSIIKLTSIAALGLAIVACQPGGEDEEINAAADDLFAPVDVSSNTASQATFPTELSNTEVAVNENQSDGSVSTSENAISSVQAEGLTNSAISTVQSEGQNQITTSQPSTRLREIPDPVLVRPATSNSIITKSVQSNPVATQNTSNLSCAAPTSKAALAAYAAHCTNSAANSVQRSSVETTTTTNNATTVTTAPTKITTTTTKHVNGEDPEVTRVVRTFASVDVSCSDTPTTKAALAAYRANCLKHVGAPVRFSGEQQKYIRPTSSKTTLDTAPQAESASTDMATNDMATNDMATNDMATNDMATNDSSSDIFDSTSPNLASETSESTGNTTPSTTTEKIEESPVAPSGSALFDCSKDPSTGAELALFRAYCQG